VLLRLGFHPAPILLGFVLGPRFEENFRRAMLISRGDLAVFVERPISAVFVGMCVLLIGVQIYVRLRGGKAVAELPTPSLQPLPEKPAGPAPAKAGGPLPAE
jgi:TctA family transporter